MRDERREMAMHFMAAMLTDSTLTLKDAPYLAREAVAYADALLEALRGGPGAPISNVLNLGDLFEKANV